MYITFGGTMHPSEAVLCWRANRIGNGITCHVRAMRTEDVTGLSRRGLLGRCRPRHRRFFRPRSRRIRGTRRAPSAHAGRRTENADGMAMRVSRDNASIRGLRGRTGRSGRWGQRRSPRSWPAGLILAFHRNLIFNQGQARSSSSAWPANSKTRRASASLEYVLSSSAFR